MRITLRHEITSTFDRPVSALLRVLRVTPWSIENQHLDAWRLDVDCDCRLRSGDDAFANVVDTISADHAIESLSIVAQGEVVTTDTAGVLRNAVERFPPLFYLRDTDATAADEPIREFADKVAGEVSAPLDRLHALLAAITAEVAVAPANSVVQTAIETFREEKGTARDLAHLFIAAARHLGIPARYVSGALVQDVLAQGTDASHAWAEAYVPTIGWIGFDPFLGLCTHEGHIRVAVAPDHLGAAPVRHAPIYGATETLKTRLIACEGCEIKHKQERSFGMSQEQFQR